jgi:hypothetical protein
MRRAVPVLMAIGVLAAVAKPATATHGGFHPTFREERVYYHCGDGTKLKNIDHAQSGGLIPWNTTAPSQSAEDGAGCGKLDPASLRNTQTPGGGPFDLAVGGTYTGNLQNMTIEMHLLAHSPGNAPTDTRTVTPWLVIDGETFLADQTMLAAVPMVSENSGATRKIEFTITNLGKVTEIKDAQGNVTGLTLTGLAKESANGEHEIQLNVRARGLGAENALWVWDTTEVPSGITFNDTTPSTTKVQATPPS